jgi:cation transport ATPase
VGLAIGNGTNVAFEAAGITLVSGSLAGVVTAIGLSRATMRNIRQNLFFALVYNAISIPVAAGIAGRPWSSAAPRPCPVPVALLRRKSSGRWQAGAARGTASIR